MPLSPCELVAARDAQVWDDAGRPKAGVKLWEDIRQIADMVTYLGYYSPPLDQQAGFPHQERDRYHHYRCKNLLPDGRCGIYESRPGMCRRFPNGRSCQYAACRWSRVNGEDGPPPPEDAYDAEGTAPGAE